MQVPPTDSVGGGGGWLVVTPNPTGYHPYYPARPLYPTPQTPHTTTTLQPKRLQQTRRVAAVKMDWIEVVDRL